MISRKLAGVSAAGVGAVTAAATLLLGSVPGSAVNQAVNQPASTGSAYGIAASGALSIAPVPRIVTPPDGEDALLEVPGVGVLEVAAARYASSATAGQVALAELVDADLIKATCDNGVGAVSILNGSIAGTALPSAPGIGEDVNVSPILSVVLNRQSDNLDGTRTIDAVVLSLLPGAGLDVPIRPLNQTQAGLPNLEVLQDVITVRDLLEDLQKLSPNRPIPLQEDAGLEVVISSATCGTDVPVAGVPVPGEGPILGEAPVPEVVETRLPVTH